MHPDLDVEVYSKYEKRLAQLKPTRDFDLQRMALTAAVKLGTTGFRASKGWVEKFRKRRGIVLRVTTRLAESSRKRTKTRTRIRRRYSPKGTKEVQVVQPPGDPECLTVCLTICADGLKFPTSIVFKGNKKTEKLSPRILNKLVMPENERIYGTHSG
ncbi:hypothetical protein RvY_08421 [Ramazzottius varieornatus]|uniref:HTH CENPB-type domain-containing protein n=1 Tax=Ramazzottius varieornatus TaxID=947166 RepID=A0A1D1VAD3_RAMVA|nr:hypothetical protein RvY_08421 [Ramazzottius varieornatus]